METSGFQGGYPGIWHRFEKRGQQIGLDAHILMWYIGDPSGVGGRLGLRLGRWMLENALMAAHEAAY
jgi:hypothetical protein